MNPNMLPRQSYPNQHPSVVDIGDMDMADIDGSRLFEMIQEVGSSGSINYDFGAFDDNWPAADSWSTPSGAL